MWAMMNDGKKHSVTSFHHCLNPSSNSIVIEDWGNITGVQATISIRLLPAAPKLSDFAAAVWLTGDCSIHN
jgi:hypothetical protein